jgi:iron(III) transport system ATP-binding protein
VALARALIMEPKVLLMDEPLSNLDAKLREQMRTEIRRIQQHLAITSVYVTHDQIEAMTLSDRIVVMNEGVIEQIGTPTDVYRYPRTPFVADFIGRANFVPGVVKGQEDGLLLVDALQRQVRLTGVKEKHAVGEQVTLIVRPEMIRIVDGETKGRGIVRRAAYLGDSIDYDIEVDGQLLIVVETDPTRMVIYSEGSDVGLDLCEDCIHVLPKE